MGGRGSEATREEHLRVLAALALTFAASAAFAEAPAATTAELVLETHRTSNALDSDLALADEFALLRGSIGHTFGQERGHLRLGLEFQTSAYETYDIEDDRSLAVVLEKLQRLGPRLELRTTLSYAAISEGDELRIGPAAAIGIRTVTHKVVGALEAGVDLGDGLVLLLGAANQVERSGKTRFQDDLLPATRLEPDRNRLRFSAGLTKREERLAYGVDAAAEFVRAEELGDPPLARSFDSFRLRGELAVENGRGVKLGVQAGAEWLRDRGGLYEAVRPVYAVTLAAPLWRKLELRASLSAAFDSVDTDDPLASHVRRGEVELKLPLSDGFFAGAGAYLERRKNLLLENEERSRGAYAEIGYALSPKRTLLLRVERSESFTSILDIDEETTDVFIRLSSRL